MITAQDIEATIYCYFPFRHGDHELSLQQYTLDDTTLSLTVLFVNYEDGTIRDAYENSIPCDLEGVSRERWEAYLAGWEKAFDALAPRVAEDSSLLAALSCDPVLRDDALITAADFERVLRDPRTLDAYYAELYPSPLPTEQEYAEYLQTARPESRQEVIQRRQDAYQKARQRHPAVAARIAATYGFVLPKHVALTWAFFSSLSQSEDRAMWMLDIHPAGVLELYQDGGLERQLKPGFDARMHQVRCADLPELLLLLTNSQDRYSLFYDDPAHPPSGIVRTQREGYDQWWGETFLDGLRDWLTPLLAEPEAELEEDFIKTGVCHARFLLEALDDFQQHVDRCHEEDRADLLWSYEERSEMAASACGVSIATEQGDAAEYEFMEDLAYYQVERMQEPIAGWIARARKELADGDPRYALALGRDLHASCWSADQKECQRWQKEAKELMVSAYEALGRPALARRVEQHHACRAQELEDAYLRKN